MAAPSAWPPPPELRALYAPGGAAPDAPLPPLPPPPPREAFTAFGVTHPVVPPAPQLHAAPLYDAALPACDELRRLNKALLAAFTRLLGALGDGAAGYDAAVHEVAVLLSNVAHLLNAARAQQAADALEAQLRDALQQRRDALQRLRDRSDAAEAATQQTQQALPSLKAAADA